MSSLIVTFMNNEDLRNKQMTRCILNDICTLGESNFNKNINDKQFSKRLFWVAVWNDLNLFIYKMLLVICVKY